MEQIAVRHLPCDSGFFSFKVFADSLLQGLLPCFRLTDSKRSYILESPYAITCPDSVIDYKVAPEPLCEPAYRAGDVDPLVGEGRFRRLYAISRPSIISGCKFLH